MNLIGQFFLYNLFPSIAAGLISWVVVTVALKNLPISDARLRLTFLGLPVVKSVLILFGFGLILPYPHSFFGEIQSNALSPEQLLPWLLIWAGLLLLAYTIFIRQVRQNLLKNAYQDPQAQARIEQSLTRVRNIYHQRPLPECEMGFCYFAINAPKPSMLVSDNLHSPTALTDGGDPVIILPQKLVEILSDSELDGVIAHELGHFVIRQSGWCSTALLRRLRLISPAASLVSAQLNREEEVACDDIAVNVLGQPNIYAEALIKSYRFSQKQTGKKRRLTQPLPQLLGNKPQLSTRIERLTETAPTSLDSMYQYGIACLLWFGLILLFFSR